VRMIVPPLAHRKSIDRSLAVFFQTHRPAAFRRAISDLCDYYHVKRPRIEWYEYLDWGKTAGKTMEDGRILLVHPENWKRGRIYKSERMWVQMIYHEMAHYLFWTDAERKAESFTRRMVLGLGDRATRSASRRSAPASRRTGRISARAAAGRVRRRRSAVGLRRRRRAKGA
jgi:hypothetical protein